MGPSEYQNLIRHMEWADALIWKAVLGAPSLERDQQIRDRLHHFHSTQWAYLQVWRGEALHVPELSSFADLRALGSWARGYHRELPTYVEALPKATLDRHVEFPWAAQVAKRFGSVGPATVGESILQVVLHTTHHRAQVATRLRECGSEPPVTDFIAWVWMQRPAPQWASLETA